ncbi:MAG TPA: vanadium-dependent haloperoxidase [Longimicrobium sp.]|nr:vanadium-dependent haloperoxidase [Longimicrobium sp.]
MRRAYLRMAVAAALVVARTASAQTVTDWWEFSNKLYGTVQGVPGHPPEQERTVTRVALAMFEALNAIDRRYESYLNLPAGDPAASQDAAAATAAYRVLVASLPQHKTALDESYSIAMDAVADAPAKEAGRLIGERAAAAALAVGGIDSTIAPVPYRPRTTPGEWVATALPDIQPYMVTFHPWVIPSATALRPPPPPALGSARWARDYDEVRRLGGRASTERTPRQTLAARYRQVPELAPALRAAAATPGRTPVQNARMLAIYQMAFDDAALAMLEAKFYYNFWRPITAIRNGASDGNDATQPDPAWLPLLPTPNFPEYPCGHCTVAGAVAEVMKAEVGAHPAGGVRVLAGAVPNSAVQVFPGWDEWAREVSDSRMLGGVHYRFSNEAGEEIGRRAARMVLEKVMRPLPGRGGRR